jgi:hypothetical protein
MRLLVRLATLLAALPLQADIVHLRDSSRHRATPIKQTPGEIVLAGKLTDRTPATGRLAASSVGHAARPAAGFTQAAPADSRPTRPETPAPDFEQMLREARELVDDGDLPAALRALQRLVTHAPPDVLDALNRQMQIAHGSGLADFIAGLRIRAALDPPRGQLFELKVPTRYEAAALGRQLEPLYRTLLNRSYHGRTIEAWTRQPDDYGELRPDARRMVSDARLAAAMIGARVRFDPQLKTDIAERRQLAAVRGDLARFIAKVSRLPGFTSLDIDAGDQDDPTLIEARRLAAEQAAARQAAIEQASTEQAEDEEAATSQPADE